MRKIEKNSQSLRKKLLLAGLMFVLVVFLIASFFGKRGVFEIYKAQKEKDKSSAEGKPPKDQATGDGSSQDE